LLVPKDLLIRKTIFDCIAAPRGGMDQSDTLAGPNFTVPGHAAVSRASLPEGLAGLAMAPWPTHLRA
jgi:hypothetical protein